MSDRSVVDHSQLTTHHGPGLLVTVASFHIWSLVFVLVQMSAFPVHSVSFFSSSLSAIHPEVWLTGCENLRTNRNVVLVSFLLNSIPSIPVTNSKFL